MKGKRKLFLSLLFVVVITVLFAVPTFAKPKLDKKKATISAGQSVRQKERRTKKKPRWYSPGSDKRKLYSPRLGESGNYSSGSDRRNLYSPRPSESENTNGTKFTFQQDGWYIARLEVQVWDKSEQDFTWFYSDSCARSQKTTLTIDTSRYEINRVGYQIWFFGWNNDYMNIPWANTDFATYFILSGYGDYPEFTWK